MSLTPRLRPRNADEVVHSIAQAAAERASLCVVGGGTKRSLLAPASAVLDLTALNGITHYQPEELVLSLRAGTPLDYVESVLAERRQMLAFEPPDYARVLGTQPARTTIGGVLGCGFAGSRRLSAGNVRDHLLGFEAVSGRGERFRAGGRVIKNVTGYDLAKLMVGSWGTLAVLTEVTLRVLPQPEFETTLLVEREHLGEALADLRAVLASPLEVSCAAQLPDGRSALRLEGFHASVTERLRGLRKHFDGKGRMLAIEQTESAALWKALRDLAPFAQDARLLWRVSLPSKAAADFVEAAAQRETCSALIDWGGALIWLALDAASASSGASIREHAARLGGHAWLFRAPEALRGQLDTAHPQPAALAALSRRVKQGFDPQNVLGCGPFAAEVR